MAKRVLFVVNHAGFFLSHRLPLALGARAAGYDVHVATAPGPLTERVSAHGLPFHEVPISRSGRRAWQEAGSLLSLASLYRRLRPTLVHHVTIKPVLYGSLAARALGVPAVVNAISGLGYVFLARGARAVVLRAAILRAYRAALAHPNSRTIFQNPDDRALFEDAGSASPGSSVLIRGSGVDMNEFHPAPEPGENVVVLPARMLWDKGVGEFVGAARILKEQGVVARFQLVGEPDPNPTSVPRAQLQAWQDSGIVEWLGFRGDMAAVLRGSSVVVLPSYREGLPKSLIEAGATGRAVVTTDAPGCREIVQNGENGLLVPVRDERALAAAIRRLLESKEERARMGRRGREIVEAQYSEAHVVAQTLAVYEDLLAG